uniref:Uncharacterized protein n=1 Tax=Timema shepardi TaxID=629360 RepID=A0A7R9AKV6_TIMSH|nr:unnamed protein product [Timema shepardi]
MMISAPIKARFLGAAVFSLSSEEKHIYIFQHVLPPILELLKPIPGKRPKHMRGADNMKHVSERRRMKATKRGKLRHFTKLIRPQDGNK